MKDICCIGHITHDKIITPQGEYDMPGGTSYYFANAINSLPDDISFSLITKVGADAMPVVKDLRSKGVDVKAFDSRQTVFFENKYGNNPDQRSQRVLAKADAFTVEELEDVDARIFHLGSLLADDFSIDVVRSLAARGKVSIDAQGYLREVRGERVYPIAWQNKAQFLSCVDILQMDENEIFATAGTNSAIEAARCLAAQGVKEVVITLGSKGSLIYAEGTLHEIPAYKPRQVVDTTGCGDTYSAGYLYARSNGESYAEAGKFAAAMCTLKLEKPGAFCADINKVNELCKA
jgi:sugar/nucleoside kinase (ribokinase family)